MSLPPTHPHQIMRNCDAPQQGSATTSAGTALALAKCWLSVECTQPDALN
jgi:hypothetical protein